MNIICIDLLKPAKEIVKLSQSYNIPHEFILANRKSGFAKVYLDVDDGFAVIAVTHKRTPNKIEITQFFIDDLLKLTPVEFKKSEPTIPEPTQSEQKELSIDDILDKISLKGIDSLTILEKKFLDSNSNL
jgi:hypothetical protein